MLTMENQTMQHKSTWRPHHAAKRRGKRMAEAAARGRPFNGNPYDWDTQRAEHDAWADGYMQAKWRLERGG